MAVHHCQGTAVKEEQLVEECPEFDVAGPDKCYVDYIIKSLAVHTQV